MHATIANALIKTRSATTTFSIFQRWSCSAKYIVIDCKKCNFAIENDIFDCRKSSLRVFFKNWELGSPGYVRAYLVSSLTLTPISFFCLLNLFLSYVVFVFSFYFWESFYAFLETRRFQWAHWQIIASSCDCILAPKDQTSLRTCSIERAYTNNIDIK